MIHLLILNADIIQNSELLKKNLRGCDPHLCYWIACDAGVSCAAATIDYLYYFFTCFFISCLYAKYVP